MEADLSHLDLTGAVQSEQMDEAHGGAESLGKGSSQSRGSDAPSEHTNEQQVQYDVYAGGDDKIVKRMPAVTEGMQDAHEDIIHHGKQGTHEIIPEIRDGLGKYIRGGVHPAQDRGCEAYTQDGQKHTDHKAHSQVSVDRFAQGVIVLCAIIPRDDHACTHGDAVEETDHQEDQTSGRTDRGKGRISKEPSYHPGIEGVIKLLK